jgi:hypothetical protein
MELQNNGLPIGAEFVGHRKALKGEFFLQHEGLLGNWRGGSPSSSLFTIIRFPTYEKPLEQVDLKGRKLLGGSVRTAYRVPDEMMQFIASNGEIDEQDGNFKGLYLCLEPLPPKRKVLVLELPIVGECVSFCFGPHHGDVSRWSAKSLEKYAGGTIEERD